MTFDSDQPAGSAHFKWLNEWSLVIEWSGVGNFRVVSDALSEVRRVLKTRPLRYLVCDTLRVTSYEPDLRGPADALLKEAKARGMTELIVVAQLPALRMLAFGLGLIVRTRTRVFVTRQEAEAYCQKLALTHSAPRTQ